jgi:hypothetical protein
MPEPRIQSCRRGPNIPLRLDGAHRSASRWWPCDIGRHRPTSSDIEGLSVFLALRGPSWRRSVACVRLAPLASRAGQEGGTFTYSPSDQNVARGIWPVGGAAASLAEVLRLGPSGRGRPPGRRNRHGPSRTKMSCFAPGVGGRTQADTRETTREEIAGAPVQA